MVRSMDNCSVPSAAKAPGGVWARERVSVLYQSTLNKNQGRWPILTEVITRCTLVVVVEVVL